MLNFFRSNTTAFGLDVSSNSCKLMQLGSDKKSVRVRGFTDVNLPKGVVVNDEVTDGKTFLYMLKQGLDKPAYGQFNTNHIVANLPESKSFVRVIQIPSMSDAEAESAIPFEAESFIPLPIDQVYLDWQKIADVGDKMSILIIASPRDYVNKHLELLDQAGLKTVALEVESQSCHRALIGSGSRETSLILDMDAYRSSLVMIEEGFLQFTSSVPIAGNSFTESIATALGISSAKAEEIKKKAGIANLPIYPNIKTALWPVLNNLSGEIKSILKFHGEHSDKQVGRIILSGGGAKLKNLQEFLGPQLTEFPGIKVELGDPWQKLPTLVQPPLDPYGSLGFVTAIGLAIRGAGLPQ